MLPPTQISLFEAIKKNVDLPLPQFKATKTTLVHLSHSMEDLILQHHIPAMLFTGFQKSSHWATETARYRALSNIAKQVTIFAGQPVPEAQDINAIQVTLRAGDPLRQEWFVAVLSKRFSAVLCGLDAGIETAREADRVFDTIWTMVPEQVNAVLDALEGIMEEYVPEKHAALQQARQEMAPTEYDPTLMTYFVRDLVNFEEQLNGKLREAERDLRQTNEVLEATVRERTAQLRHANRELQRMSQLKDEFVANISHELRTPVTSIKLYHHLMERSPENRTRYFTTLKREVKRLEALIDDLLFVSGMEKDNDETTPTNIVDLNTLVRQFAIDRQAAAREHHLTLTAQPASYMVTVIGDQMMLARMISAVLTNAITYTPEDGHITLATRVETDETGRWAVVTVQDTGPGITPEEQEQIFARFYRGRNQSIQSKAGTGLGLSIAKQIAEQHAGSISVESDGKSGSIFIMRLPHHDARASAG